MNKCVLCFVICLLGILACNTATDEPNSAKNDSVHTWAKKSSIYEVNIRQYTPEGTFEALLPHLTEIKDLGADILWLMPIHPIGKKNRKGGLGSYYAVKDYKAVNPNFGTETEFRTLVDSAHAMGFKIILDWVANHTAWDHHWVNEHPDFYTKDSTGKAPMVPEGTDWTDVADLDYENEELHAVMIEAMQYWVREFDIDGYRCDVAGFVPLRFWEKAVDSLKMLKNVFMLAEWDEPKMHEAFHMTYAWGFHHLLSEIVESDQPQQLLMDFFEEENQRYSDSAYRMYFITNHDENSWKQSVFERYGEHVELLAVLTFTIDGMPLVYSGQEIGMDKALAFFDKDTIDWKESKWRPFYRKLLQLHESSPVLWNGSFGAQLQWLEVPPQTIGYKRVNQEGEGIYVYLNLSDQERTISSVPALKQYMASEESHYLGDSLRLPPSAYFVGETEKN